MESVTNLESLTQANSLVNSDTGKTLVLNGGMDNAEIFEHIQKGSSHLNKIVGGEIDNIQQLCEQTNGSASDNDEPDETVSGNNAEKMTNKHLDQVGKIAPTHNNGIDSDLRHEEINEQNGVNQTSQKHVERPAAARETTTENIEENDNKVIKAEQNVSKTDENRLQNEDRLDEECEISQEVYIEQQFTETQEPSFNLSELNEFALSKQAGETEPIQWVPIQCKPVVEINGEGKTHSSQTEHNPSGGKNANDLISRSLQIEHDSTFNHNLDVAIATNCTRKQEDFIVERNAEQSLSDSEKQTEFNAVAITQTDNVNIQQQQIKQESEKFSNEQKMSESYVDSTDSHDVVVVGNLVNGNEEHRLTEDVAVTVVSFSEDDSETVLIETVVTKELTNNSTFDSVDVDNSNASVAHAHEENNKDVKQEIDMDKIGLNNGEDIEFNKDIILSSEQVASGVENGVDQPTEAASLFVESLDVTDDSETVIIETVVTHELRNEEISEPDGLNSDDKSDINNTADPESSNELSNVPVVDIGNVINQTEEKSPAELDTGFVESAEHTSITFKAVNAMDANTHNQEVSDEPEELNKDHEVHVTEDCEITEPPSLIVVPLEDKPIPDIIETFVTNELPDNREEPTIDSFDSDRNPDESIDKADIDLDKSDLNDTHDPESTSEFSIEQVVDVELVEDKPVTVNPEIVVSNKTQEDTVGSDGEGGNHHVVEQLESNTTEVTITEIEDAEPGIVITKSEEIVVDNADGEGSSIITTTTVITTTSVVSQIIIDNENEVYPTEECETTGPLIDKPHEDDSDSVLIETNKNHLHNQGESQLDEVDSDRDCHISDQQEIDMNKSDLNYTADPSDNVVVVTGNVVNEMEEKDLVDSVKDKPVLVEDKSLILNPEIVTSSETQEETLESSNDKTGVTTTEILIDETEPGIVITKSIEEIVVDNSDGEGSSSIETTTVITTTSVISQTVTVIDNENEDNATEKCETTEPLIDEPHEDESESVMIETNKNQLPNRDESQLELVDSDSPISHESADKQEIDMDKSDSNYTADPPESANEFSSEEVVVARNVVNEMEEQILIESVEDKPVSEDKPLNPEIVVSNETQEESGSEELFSENKIEEIIDTHHVVDQAESNKTEVTTTEIITEPGIVVTKATEEIVVKNSDGEGGSSIETTTIITTTTFISQTETNTEIIEDKRDPISTDSLAESKEIDIHPDMTDEIDGLNAVEPTEVEVESVDPETVITEAIRPNEILYDTANLQQNFDLNADENNQEQSELIEVKPPIEIDIQLNEEKTDETAPPDQSDEIVNHVSNHVQLNEDETDNTAPPDQFDEILNHDQLNEEKTFDTSPPDQSDEILNHDETEASKPSLGEDEEEFEMVSEESRLYCETVISVVLETTDDKTTFTHKKGELIDKSQLDQLQRQDINSDCEAEKIETIIQQSEPSETTLQASDVIIVEQKTNIDISRDIEMENIEAKVGSSIAENNNDELAESNELNTEINNDKLVEGDELNIEINNTESEAVKEDIDTIKIIIDENGESQSTNQEDQQIEQQNHDNVNNEVTAEAKEQELQESENKADGKTTTTTEIVIEEENQLEIISTATTLKTDVEHFELDVAANEADTTDAVEPDIQVTGTEISSRENEEIIITTTQETLVEKPEICAGEIKAVVTSVTPETGGEIELKDSNTDSIIEDNAAISDTQTSIMSQDTGGDTEKQVLDISADEIINDDIEALKSGDIINEGVVNVIVESESNKEQLEDVSEQQSVVEQSKEVAASTEIITEDVQGVVITKTTEESVVTNCEGDSGIETTTIITTTIINETEINTDTVLEDNAAADSSIETPTPVVTTSDVNTVTSVESSVNTDEECNNIESKVIDTEISVTSSIETPTAVDRTDVNTVTSVESSVNIVEECNNSEGKVIVTENSVTSTEITTTEIVNISEPENMADNNAAETGPKEIIAILDASSCTPINVDVPEIKLDEQPTVGGDTNEGVEVQKTTEITTTHSTTKITVTQLRDTTSVVRVNRPRSEIRIKVASGDESEDVLATDPEIVEEEKPDESAVGSETVEDKATPNVEIQLEIKPTESSKSSDIAEQKKDSNQTTEPPEVNPQSTVEVKPMEGISVFVANDNKDGGNANKETIAVETNIEEQKVVSEEAKDVSVESKEVPVVEPKEEVSTVVELKEEVSVVEPKEEVSVVESKEEVSVVEPKEEVSVVEPKVEVSEEPKEISEEPKAVSEESKIDQNKNTDQGETSQVPTKEEKDKVKPKCCTIL